MLEHIEDLFDNSVDATDMWTKANRQLVTDCLSRKYEISGKPLYLRELALHAMAWVPGVAAIHRNSIKTRHGPIGDSSAIQISNALHREYNVRAAALDPRSALVELARDVEINVEFVVIFPQEQNKEDEYMKECEERFEFAKSIGATTVQIRTKFPWVRIIEDDEPFPAQPTPDGRLVSPEQR
ncbi:hypothetical protein N656DRAFT_801874 [Canariomyces notabilis]|uniref:Uncharacterized protein n=1 Tax=Canariomyces notabilis TaxID=2074819 RepID=A0AAN6QDL5_9PEZI|nr:hypothetical protein N656DRAFT_801874 [Canariomyces arenarius]